MNLVPRKQFSGLVGMREEMDRLWDRFMDDWPMPAVFGKGWSPTADVSETKDKLIIKAELPGLEPDDIKITLSGDLLTIKGEKKKEKEEKDEQHYSLERYCGEFQRCFRLPVEVKADKIEADFDKGVLTITMPKVAKSAQKEIKINKAK